MHSVEDVPSIKAIFETTGDSCRFMEGTPKRQKVYKEHLKAQGINLGKVALHALSDTRWLARSDNVDVLLDAYPALLSMFKKLSEQNIAVATGLLVRFKLFSFVVK